MRQGKVVPLDLAWPGHALPVMPGDFSQYLPDGMGLSVPVLVGPADRLEDSLARPGYYGFFRRDSDPVRGAPRVCAAGGTIYFHRRERWDDLQAVLRLMGVNLVREDFIVVAGSSADPGKERFADQARIIPRSVAANLFRAADAVADVPEHGCSVADYLRQFVEEQVEKWNGDGATFTPRMYGMFGGDGDWAKEELCFGFMVENSDLDVYRIWSRAWLVTK